MTNANPLLSAGASPQLVYNDERPVTRVVDDVAYLGEDKRQRQRKKSFAEEKKKSE